jgi:hypothetical protein
MFLRQSNSISSYKTTFDVEKAKNLNFNETDLAIYHILVKESEKNGPVFVDEKTSRYIDMFFYQKNTNWYKPIETRYQTKRIPARACR